MALMDLLGAEGQAQLRGRSPEQELMASVQARPVGAGVPGFVDAILRTLVAGKATAQREQSMENMEVEQQARQKDLQRFLGQVSAAAQAKDLDALLQFQSDAVQLERAVPGIGNTINRMVETVKESGVQEKNPAILITDELTNTPATNFLKAFVGKKTKMDVILSAVAANSRQQAAFDNATKLTITDLLNALEKKSGLLRNTFAPAKRAILEQEIQQINTQIQALLKGGERRQEGALPEAPAGQEIMPGLKVR